MLHITCPLCGPRDEEEFTYGTQAGIVRPEDTRDMTDEEWADYLFLRENPRGVNKELWLHTYGCRQWFFLERNTMTNHISAVFDANGNNILAENKEGEK